jgi:hypothetical protein
MPSFVYDPDTYELVDKATYYAQKARRQPSKAATDLPMPYVRGDLPTYISPVTRKPVDGRRERREDLAKAGCREVDPSEFKPIYRNYEFCQKRRLPFMGGDVPPPMTKDEKVWAKERRAKEDAAVKAVGAKKKPVTRG